MINIAFDDWWQGFNLKDNFITKLLDGNIEYDITDNPDKADFLFCSIEKINCFKYKCPRILFTGENYSPNFNRPADVHRRVHMRARPRHDLAELLPVVYVLEFELLDGRSGEDHTVVKAVLDLGKILVERLEVREGGIAGDVLHLQKLHIDLQRRVREQAHELRLRLDLLGHQVQDEHPERSDILMLCAKLRHDKDIFLFESFISGQIFGNSDRHGVLPPC